MKSILINFVTALCLSSVILPVIAQDEETSDTAPEVTIGGRKSLTIEEFRSHGKVYMIKVFPKKGPPYYLIDADGDGNFDTRRSDLEPNLVIPSWVLFSW